jgi:hypothetical protein
MARLQSRVCCATGPERLGYQFEENLPFHQGIFSNKIAQKVSLRIKTHKPEGKELVAARFRQEIF